MKPRQESPAALLARIRSYDLAAWSDAGLRQAFARLESRSGSVAADILLPECFAILAEAIDRRLGVWRLFDQDPGDSERDQTVTQALAAVAEQRTYCQSGEILLPAGFYQAARRQDADGQLRFRATDEQLLAGIHLFRGKVAQMDAGEGKTVAAAFPAALHALMGRSVHVVTANDYLAGRDSRLLEPVYRSLGLSAGAILQHTEPGERRLLYRRSIVYGAMRELGFDYLRDNLKSNPDERVQRIEISHAVAIIDEADHALIDEAFTPMIISGNPTGSSRTALRADRAVAGMIRAQRSIAGQLEVALEAAGRRRATWESAQIMARLMLAQPSNPELQRRFAAQPGSRKRAWAWAEEQDPGLTADLYYAVHPGSRFVSLTERGRDFLEQRLGPFYSAGDEGDSPADEEIPLPMMERRRRAGRAARSRARRYRLGNQALQSLRAHLLLQRDVDYLVDGGAVALIDQHTGRPKPENIYQHGLQAAVEAKEGVTIHPDSETLAWISVAGFVGLYGRVSSITGTAVPAAGEFRRKYGLEVAVVPPVKQPARATTHPKVFLNREDKLAAVADEVAMRHRMGQPVLAATRTVEQSEELSRELSRRGIPHQLLNAVTTHAEARIVRGAGRFGAVTVSTPMAGRGTDILLEPGLNSQLTQRCVAEILRLLAGGAGAVDVSCPAPEQAHLLRVELERDGLFCIFPSVPGGAGTPGLLRVTRHANNRRKGSRSIEFALGLCVIGTEIYDSQRGELQLHGRSGRQGEFGLAQTFLSLEDRLVNLAADGIRKLSKARRTGSGGREFYTGPEVARRIAGLQAAADREGEAQRSLLQDYAAEFDRQTNLYHQRRRQVIESEATADPSRETAQRVALGLAAQYLGPDAEDSYLRRFRRLAEEAQADYGVDCSALYGADLSTMPAELSALFADHLKHRINQAGEGGFRRVVRLLWLQVCGELWPAHIAGLRDSLTSQLLSPLNHKSAVAQYIRRSNDAWREYWKLAEAEFLSRLLAFPLSPPPEEPLTTVSSETELLLAQESAAR